MRAAFSLLALVIVAALVLYLGKRQLETLPRPVPAASAAASGVPTALPQPQAVGQQVQGAIDAAAQREAEAASAAQ